MKKIIEALFSTRAAGLYMLLFALAIGVATFIENDFGTPAAQKLIFKAKWFEFLMLLFAISIIVNIFRFRMFQQKKWGTLLFHLSIIMIFIGAAITRYISYEGMMHIREGRTSDSFLSAKTYLKMIVEKDGKSYSVQEPVLFASLGNNKEKYRYNIAGEIVELEVVDFVPNPVELLEPKTNGEPVMKLVYAGGRGREEYIFKKNDKLQLGATRFNFTDKPDPRAIHFKYRRDTLFLNSPRTLSQLVMATQKRDTLEPNIYHPLVLRSLYSDGRTNFVIPEFYPSAVTRLQSGDIKLTSEALGAAVLKVKTPSGEKEVIVKGKKGSPGKPAQFSIGDTKFRLSYGAKRIKLPFSLKLRDFILERYPGTNSASSYASEVTLIDPRKDIQFDKRIYMNHILNYGGYRFFQSSYDPDELGTYLSVNHDFWGTWVSYIGYFLFTIGFAMSFFQRRGRFRSLQDRLKRMEGANAAKSFLLCVLFGLSTSLSAQSGFEVPQIDGEHAERFSKIVLQDYKGRMEPVHTLASEILRKVSRKRSIYGQSPEQVLLGMTIYPEKWGKIPLIKLTKHDEILNILEAGDGLMAYEDFFDERGQYKLKDYVREAFGMDQKDRGTFEKAIIKLDERVNIVSMVFSNRMMRLFPVKGDPNNTWISTNDAVKKRNQTGEDTFDNRYFIAYGYAVDEAIKSGDWSLANELLGELTKYQKKHGSAVYPGDKKINFEVLLNKMNVFNRLGAVYGLMGLLFLLLFFASVFIERLNKSKFEKIAFYLLLLAFLFHTVGLGIRWYVSGRAPWSNGYESMIYIAWTTILAGLFFARKSLGGLAATAILSATILLVAMLSYLDPEITPLVPVLKSYWLTIHVSLEAGSYGFLMLGAILGVLNMILMVFAGQKKKDYIYKKIKELSYISEMTLFGGLFMVSVGTYLGGIWANESWGRYWGWDAKETWALVTVLVYAFILHMRFIPGIRGLFAYNFATLFGFASVIMTYYGVNYYLSGLHSYATGDPVPIPMWVYYSVFFLSVLSLVAFFRFRKLYAGKS